LNPRSASLRLYRGLVTLSFIFFATLARPVRALEVQFILTDKMGQAIPGASICLQEDAGQCQTTDSQGKSVFSPTVSLRPAPSDAPGLSFSVRAGSLVIDAPQPAQVRLQRFATNGRRIGPALFLSLHAGPNPVPWRGPSAGLAFFRLETEHERYAFPVLSDPGNPARISVLGKIATANLHAFTITKSGYQAALFRPRKDLDTAIIRMAAEGDTGLPYAGLIRARLLDIDSANHLLHYAYAEPGCNGSAPVSQEAQSSLPIWIKGGKWYIPAGNCYGVALAKDGDGLYGQWKSQGLVPLPSGLFPMTCDPSKDSLVTSVPNLFFLNEGGGWDIDLKSDSLTIRIRRRACLGNQLIGDPTTLDGQNGHLMLVKNTCQEVVLKNSRNEAATYSYPASADSLQVSFAYGDKTCVSAGVPLILDTTAPKVCPETQSGVVLADTTWQACVRTSGFGQ